MDVKDSRVHAINTGMSWCYLVEGSDGLVLVDTGAPGNEKTILREVRRIGRGDLRLIYITHAHLDHYGSADALRRLTGAPIAVHEADAEAMALGETRLASVRLWGHVVKALLPFAPARLRPPPTPADERLCGGDRLTVFGLDAEVIHTPGHTPGSTSLLVDGRLLFVGDLVSSMGWPHPQLLYAHDWNAIGESVRRLQAMGERIAWVYPGHGGRPLSAASFARIKTRPQARS